MNIKQFHVYLANLDPSFGTEPGKIRPVVVLQTDLLNGLHPSTIVCPLSTRKIENAEPLRLPLSRQEAKLKYDSYILIDQIRAIDNRRFIKNIGTLTVKHRFELQESLKIILFE